MFAVIVNPVSGGGEAMKLAQRVMQRLDKDGRESRLFETGGEGDAARQIHSAVEAGYSSVVCIGGDGTLCEAVEVSANDFFVGVQFHPEFKSRPNNAHPLFREFIRHACAYSEKKGNES